MAADSRRPESLGSGMGYLRERARRHPRATPRGRPGRGSDSRRRSRRRSSRRRDGQGPRARQPERPTKRPPARARISAPAATSQGLVLKPSVASAQPAATHASCSAPLPGSRSARKVSASSRCGCGGGGAEVRVVAGGGKAREQDRLGLAPPRGRRERAAVEPGAGRVGAEGLAGDRRVHDAGHHLAVDRGRDRDAPGRQAAGEVGGAVDRVDVPDDAARPLSAAFLADDGRVGHLGADARGDHRLGGAVVGGDDVAGVALGRYRHLGAEGGAEHRAHLAGGGLGDGHQPGAFGAARSWFLVGGRRRGAAAGCHFA